MIRTRKPERRKRKSPEIHGQGKTKLYGVWKSIIERCENEKHRYYARYGGRGISICPEWRNSFLAFKEWALENGYVQGLQIDRKENDKGYSPDNCRFTTFIVNNNNRDVTWVVDYKGEKQSICLLLRSMGRINDYATIRRRITKFNWPVEKAIDIPIRSYAKHNETAR